MNADLTELGKTIEALSTTLSHSRDSMTEAVDSFEAFASPDSHQGGLLTHVQTELAPIITLTQQVMASQQNINHTIEEFERVQGFFDVLDKVRPVLSDIKLEDTIEKRGILRGIDQLTQSIVFMKQNQSMKSASTALESMQLLLKQAVDSLCSEYRINVQQSAPKSQEYLTLSEEGKQYHLQGLSKRICIGLRNIAGCIHRNGFVDRFRDMYQDIRAPAVTTTLQRKAETVWPQLAKLDYEKAMSSAIKSGKSKSGFQSFKDQVGLPVIYSSEINSKTGEYGLVQIFRLALNMFQVENEFAEMILPAGDLAKMSFLEAMIPCSLQLEFIASEVALNDVKTNYTESQRLFIYAGKLLQVPLSLHL